MEKNYGYDLTDFFIQEEITPQDQGQLNQVVEFDRNYKYCVGYAVILHDEITSYAKSTLAIKYRNKYLLNETSWSKFPTKMYSEPFLNYFTPVCIPTSEKLYLEGTLNATKRYMLLFFLQNTPISVKKTINIIYKKIELNETPSAPYIKSVPLKIDTYYKKAIGFTVYKDTNTAWFVSLRNNSKIIVKGEFSHHYISPSDMPLAKSFYPININNFKDLTVEIYMQATPYINKYFEFFFLVEDSFNDQNYDSK